MDIPIIPYRAIQLSGRTIDHGSFSTIHIGEFDGKRVAVKVYDKRRTPKYLARRIYHSASHEYSKIAGLREKCPNLYDNLQNPLGITNSPQGEAFVSELVTDYDGTISTSLSHCYTVPMSFVFDARRVIERVNQCGEYFIEISAPNILCKKELDKLTPVFVDFQRFNTPIAFPFVYIRARLGLIFLEQRDHRRFNSCLSEVNLEGRLVEEQKYQPK